MAFAEQSRIDEVSYYAERDPKPSFMRSQCNFSWKESVSSSNLIFNNRKKTGERIS